MIMTPVGKGGTRTQAELGSCEGARIPRGYGGRLGRRPSLVMWWWGGGMAGTWSVQGATPSFI